MAAPQRVDIVVVGSGGAGLSAALAASAKGSRVLVLEKSDLLGGTTALSGGGIWVPCHHYQHTLGVEDSRDDALAYIRAVAPDGWHNVEEPLWASFVDHAPQMLKCLEANSPLTFAASREPDPYAEAPGGKAFGRDVSPRPLKISLLGALRGKLRGPQFAPWINYEELMDTTLYVMPKRGVLRLAPRLLYRILTNTRVMGNALIIGLLKGCIDKGCDVWTGARAEKLVKTNGRISAIRVRRGDQLVDIEVAKGVVLASGGFEWDDEMMAEHFPGYPVAWRGSPSSNTGDGHRMAREVGARFDRMDQAIVYGTVPTPYEGGVRGAPVGDYTLPHAMIVGRHGRRFMNEKQANSGLAFMERDPATGAPAHLPAWRIYDSQYAAKYAHALPKDSPHGTLYKDDTIAGLARQIGVDPDTLTDTARRLSDFARSGADEDFGRGTTIWDLNRGVDPRVTPNPALGTIEVPPFYAFPFEPSFLGTKGGPRTNAQGQVVDEEGEIIPGLYAAGNLMANPFGTKGIGGGTTLGPVLTWGYICGVYAHEEAVS
jgi:3-oxosteroid 1-dehydrogenase